ncbi:hypothetical protein [Fusobacterium sp.]|uniref:hypothetical protein n=1 Tax=Fusobacterium sp. TaxID=68766 RepID=UPI0026348C4D|nr:hypothetical protein [Fusobacterium sp.]
MKKKCFFIFICLMLLSLFVGCNSLEKREFYDSKNEVGRYEEMPYFPTFSQPNSESQRMSYTLFTMSIIGIPYVVADYTASTILDVVSLPFDIYRNNVEVPERKKYKKVNDELSDHYYKTLKKLEHTKSEKEKALIKAEYKKTLDEYCNKLRELDANFVFHTQPYYRYRIE